MAFHNIKTSNGIFEDPLTKSQLKKWDMLKATQCHTFRYTKYYHRLQGAELAKDMLSDPDVQAVFNVMLKGGGWQPLSGNVSQVQADTVPCTLTRMDVFDKLSSPSAHPPIVRPATGELVRRMDDTREGFQILDNLRELLLCEESENAELFSDEEKKEMLWRVFEHLCLGGPCCQYEDKLDTYLEAAKRIYKELVTVQKNASGQVEVASTVIKITSIRTESGEEVPLFPVHSKNSFLYLTVDPIRRLARLWYHAFVPYW